VPPATPGYEIRIGGTVSDALLSCFTGMAGELVGGDTVLRGYVPDQVDLHRLLDRLQALGLEIILLRRLPPGHLES